MNKNGIAILVILLALFLKIVADGGRGFIQRLPTQQANWPCQRLAYERRTNLYLWYIHACCLLVCKCCMHVNANVSVCVCVYGTLPASCRSCRRWFICIPTRTCLCVSQHNRKHFPGLPLYSISVHLYAATLNGFKWTNQKVRDMLREREREREKKAPITNWITFKFSSGS